METGCFSCSKVLAWRGSSRIWEGRKSRSQLCWLKILWIGHQVALIQLQGDGVGILAVLFFFWRGFHPAHKCWDHFDERNYWGWELCLELWWCSSCNTWWQVLTLKPESPELLKVQTRKLTRSHQPTWPGQVQLWTLEEGLIRTCNGKGFQLDKEMKHDRVLHSELQIVPSYA